MVLIKDIDIFVFHLYCRVCLADD